MSLKMQWLWVGKVTIISKKSQNAVGFKAPEKKNLLIS